MTIEQELQEEILREKEKIVRVKARIAKLEERHKSFTKKDLNKRRYLVGALAHEAGLFAWSNADLALLFQDLAQRGNLLPPATLLEEAPMTQPRIVPQDLRMPDVLPTHLESSTPQGTPGVVYVLQMEGHPWLKIGYTYGGLAGLRIRVSTLQIGCPQPLHVRQAYTCPLPANLEWRIHKILAASRRLGEWFETDLPTIDKAVQTLWLPEWDEAPLPLYLGKRASA